MVLLEIEEYQKMYRLEEFYWWFVGRRKIILSLLSWFRREKSNCRILDVGCGTGMMLNYLKEFGISVGVDNATAALQFSRYRGNRLLLQGDAERLPIKSNCFDLITALDLLEHLEDDIVALKEFHRVTKPGGIVLITVPAFKFLWSEHDDALKHKRRYEAKELKRKVQLAGFKIIKLSYAVTVLFLGITVYKFLQKTLKKKEKPKTALLLLPPPINAFFVWTLNLEANLLKKLSLPFGTSIVCMLEK